MRVVTTNEMRPSAMGGSWDGVVPTDPQSMGRANQGTAGSPVAKAVDQDVVYLALSHNSTALYADDLTAFGFTVRFFTSIASICATLAPGAAPLIALQATPHTIHLAVAKLRSVFRRAGIVVIADAPDRLTRTDIMLSGADACVESAPGSMELMAAILASRRRMEAERSRPEVQAQPAFQAQSDSRPALTPPAQEELLGQWHLVDKGWVLVAPNGARLEMTWSERQIIGHFLKKPDVPLTRESQGAIHDPITGQISRGIDVNISRLKKKAASKGMMLPIRSIRGTGYIFVSNDPLADIS